MSVATPQLFTFHDSFARELEGLYVPWQGKEVAEPRLLVLNEPLAEELGAEPAALRADDGVAVLAGTVAPEGATTVAQAYAGHQFGAYSPRLGDGRALLLGEVVDIHGRRRDIHLKGSGRTPFARGGDGKAVIGPMLREYVIGEAMHALGIPTSRALAVVATGERVMRERPLPGAVLARVAASHIRVGTFQYAAASGNTDLLRRLADYSIRRHHPDADGYLDLYERVVEAQASLIAQWMLVGFIHGVMNTDNMAVSGETIDYGPCAFMDAFDPATVYSSIDYGGRYAFGNQPHIGPWNLARLAESLLPLIDDDTDAAVEAVTAVLNTWPERFNRHWTAGMRAKLGLTEPGNVTDALIDDLLRVLHEHRLDYTSTFRELAGYLRGEALPAPPLADWLARWREHVDERAADAMDQVNPVYIPRNHLVEAALEAATAGDLEPFHRLVEVVSSPFEARPGLEDYAAPAPEDFGPYVTYCGT
ncbi:MAG TPA: YdiU family protein [Solirubrobacter sp.]|nr:YdiU family protein [Solirubrobacter sp.]